jgi:release factor glutamine methyltransferase
VGRPGIGLDPAVSASDDIDRLTERLEEAGFVAAREDAEDLTAAAGGDQAVLRELVERRLTGEPLAWITGSVVFCEIDVRVDPGVYVPRWHTEPLARRAVAYLRADGIAVDVCTGSGAVAKVLMAARPAARVVATDIDAAAVACATANGVDAYHGDLFGPLPDDLRGRVNVIVAVVPYVPTAALTLLPSDTFRFERELPYDGGDDGLAVLRRVVAGAPAFLRPGGRLLVEIGGDEAEPLIAVLRACGFGAIEILRDEEDDVRGVDGRFDGGLPAED